MVSSMAKPGIVEQAWAAGKFPSRHPPAEDFISNLRFQISDSMKFRGFAWRPNIESPAI
jgi:hypothetical protein